MIFSIYSATSFIYPAQEKDQTPSAVKGLFFCFVFFFLMALFCSGAEKVNELVKTGA